MRKGVNSVLSTLAGMLVGGAVIGKISKKRINEKQEINDKIVLYYRIFNQWISIYQEGKSLKNFFKNNNYKSIAIYGMKELGERLYDELRDSDIIVKYIIDKNAGEIYADIDVVTPEDNLEPVDVIVVTATFYYDEIKNMLREKVDYPVVSLEDILYEI